MTKQKSSTTLVPQAPETALQRLQAARAILDKVSARHMKPGSLLGANTHFENAVVELQANAIAKE